MTVKDSGRGERGDKQRATRIELLPEVWQNLQACPRSTGMSREGGMMTPGAPLSVFVRDNLTSGQKRGHARL